MADLIEALLGPLVGGAVNAAGKAGQAKATRFCYEVARRATSHPNLVIVGAKPVSLPEWEDLTQRQQETWMSALWDVVQERKGE